MIFSPFLLLYIFFRWRQRPATIPHFSFLLPYFAGLLLAFALSAWFFIPALLEQSLAQLEPVTEGYFHFSNHFRGADLIQWRFFFDYNPDGGVAFRMGLVQAGTAVLGIIIWARERRPQVAWGRGAGEQRTFVIASFLIATFMITPLSQLLWEHLPLLSFTQFPWRFLSVQAFAGALAAGGLALLPWKKWVVSGTAVLLLIAGLSHLQTDHLALTDADVTAVNLAQYEWFTSNIGTTISAEYLPPTVQPRPYTSAWLTTGERDAVRALSGELLAAQRTNDRMTHQIWELETVVSTETAVSSTLIFPTLHWPGWVGELDGDEVEIRPSPGSGLIMLDVPPGTHTLTLRLTRTPVRLWAELASLAALLATLWLMLRDWRLETGDRRTKLPNRQSLVSSLILLALVIAVRLWPQKTFSANNLTWDFAQMGYLHHDETIEFSNGAVLTGYTIAPEDAVAGEMVNITLTWQTAVDAEAVIALTTPAKLRQNQAALLVEQTHPIQVGAVTYQLIIPENAPAGLVMPRLLLDNGRALMPSGKTRGELYLRPFRIAQSSRIPHQPSRLDARVIHAAPRDGVLDVQMAWFTPRELSQNYNVSLRLLDKNGIISSQFDTQPGYGFLPSSGWPANEWVNDWLTVPIPALENAPYALVAYLYDVETGQIVLTRRLGELDEALAFAARALLLGGEVVVDLTAVFEPEIATVLR